MKQCEKLINRNKTRAPVHNKTSGRPLRQIITIIIIMYNYTSYNWSHWNSNEKLKEKPGSYTRKRFDRFTTENSYTWNITHNTESTAV
jgi:hypothetical protein